MPARGKAEGNTGKRRRETLEEGGDGLDDRSHRSSSPQATMKSFFTPKKNQPEEGEAEEDAESPTVRTPVLFHDEEVKDDDDEDAHAKREWSEEETTNENESGDEQEREQAEPTSKASNVRHQSQETWGRDGIDETNGKLAWG